MGVHPYTQSMQPCGNTIVMFIVVFNNFFHFSVNEKTHTYKHIHMYLQQVYCVQRERRALTQTDHFRNSTHNTYLILTRIEWCRIEYLNGADRLSGGLSAYHTYTHRYLRMGIHSLYGRRLTNCDSMSISETSIPLLVRRCHSCQQWLMLLLLLYVYIQIFKYLSHFSSFFWGCGWGGGDGD